MVVHMILFLILVSLWLMIPPPDDTVAVVAAGYRQFIVLITKYEIGEKAKHIVANTNANNPCLYSDALLLI